MTGRLIDADALKAQLQREIDRYFDEDGGGIHTAMEARDEIDYAPTVDAVPVIRCKDCIHRYGNICECWNFEEVELNGFCERARREDEQPSSDAYDQISELAIERLKAEKILEQLGQNLGEVFGKIDEVIDDYCNEILKEARKKS